MEAKRKEQEAVVSIDSGIMKNELDRKFDNLFEHLLNYTKSIIDIVEYMCPDFEDQVKLATKMGETDSLLLPRLIEKECEKRRLVKLRKSMNLSEPTPTKEVKFTDILGDRVIETVKVSDIPDMILETSTEHEEHPLLIHKSRLNMDRLGMAVFSLYDEAIKGFAFFLPSEERGNVGSLHVVDEFGMKRQIRSNIKILDLDDYNDIDVYYPPGANWSKEMKMIDAVLSRDK